MTAEHVAGRVEDAKAFELTKKPVRIEMVVVSQQRTNERFAVILE
jgi:hypothetical protein